MPSKITNTAKTSCAEIIKPNKSNTNNFDILKPKKKKSKTVKFINLPPKEHIPNETEELLDMDMPLPNQTNNSEVQTNTPMSHSTSEVNNPNSTSEVNNLNYADMFDKIIPPSKQPNQSDSYSNASMKQGHLPNEDQNLQEPNIPAFPKHIKILLTNRTETVANDENHLQAHQDLIKDIYFMLDTWKQNNMIDGVVTKNKIIQTKNFYLIEE